MAWTNKIEKPKKHRARRKKDGAAKELLEGLKFIKPCQSRSGTPQQQFSCISGGWLAASDGVLTMGTKLHESLTVCPHSYKFEEALKEADLELSMTVLDNSLSVVSGEFRGIVPCIEANQLSILPPDPNIASIDDRIKDAFDVLHPLVNKDAVEVRNAAILVKSAYAVALDRRGLIEYYHGIDLPTMMIPKQAAEAIVKTKKKLTGFGFSGPSCTFWYEDESFIKTQLYEESYYPNYDSVFSKDPLEPWEVPEEFFRAVKLINKFTKSGRVYFENSKIASHELENEASTYVIKGLPEGMVFNAELLLKVRKGFKFVEFNKSQHIAYFFGDNCRGVLRSIVKNAN